MGHGGAGKTTLAEACAFVGGAIKKMGSVPQGTTLSDYDKEEQRRGFSISTALIPVEYTDQDAEPVKINFLDTPGYFDFVGEVEEAVAAADAAQIGAEDTVSMTAVQGRAALLGSQSLGHEDPGARSSALILEAAARAAGA